MNRVSELIRIAAVSGAPAGEGIAQTDSGVEKKFLTGRNPVRRIVSTAVLASVFVGVASLSHAGTPIAEVEAVLNGGSGIYIDLQSDADGFTNQGITGIWSNWEEGSWGFSEQGVSTGDGSENNGPGDGSDSFVTVFGRCADDKGRETTEIQVDYSGLTPDADYFLWAVMVQNNRSSSISHDLEWGEESGALTRIVGEPMFVDFVGFTEDVEGNGAQLVGFLLDQVTADANGEITIFYDQGLDAGPDANENRTLFDGVVLDEIVDPFCRVPWAPDGVVIESNGEPETLMVPVENIGATADLNITGTVVTGLDGTLFNADPDQFPLVLAVGEQGTIALDFDPGSFVGPLQIENIEVVCDHGGNPGTIITSPLAGTVRNPWISTVEEIAFGPVAADLGVFSFSVAVSNLGFSAQLEIIGVNGTGPDGGLFTSDIDYGATPLLVPAVVEGVPGEGQLDLTLDFDGVSGIYTTDIEIISNDISASVHTLRVVVTVVDPQPLEIGITGYDPEAGTLGVTVANVPEGTVLHLVGSADLQGFDILSPPFDFDSTTPQPFAIPADPATDPALFLRTAAGPSIE